MEGRGVLTREEIYPLTNIWGGYNRPILTKKGMIASGFERDNGLTTGGLIAETIDLDSFSDRFFLRPLIIPINPSNIDIDSVDFTMGLVIYETNRNMLLGRVSPKELGRFDAKEVKLELGEGFVLSPRKSYYVASHEKVYLPSSLDIFVDSKSTIGRLGCVCGDATIIKSLKRSPENLMVVVAPDYFPLKFTSGKSRFFQGIFKYIDNSHMTRDEILNSKEINIEVGGRKKLLEKFLDEDKLMIHVSTDKAYVSKKEFMKERPENIPPIDVDARNQDWRDYFEEIHRNEEMVLEPGRFYLLGTKEYLRLGGVCGRIERALPGHLAGLWVQFAGIVHAGFYGEITLECRTADRPVRIKDGDLFGYLQLDKLSGKVDLNKRKMSYADQRAPRLPKIFKTE